MAMAANRASPVQPRASTAVNTHGSNATDHARFGVLSIDTTGPDSANAQAPSVAAAGGTRQRRNWNVPSAAIGSGSATQRLNDTTSDGSSRIATVTGISS